MTALTTEGGDDRCSAGEDGSKKTRRKKVMGKTSGGREERIGARFTQLIADEEKLQQIHQQNGIAKDCRDTDKTCSR